MTVTVPPSVFAARKNHRRDCACDLCRRGDALLEDHRKGLIRFAGEGDLENLQRAPVWHVCQIRFDEPPRGLKCSLKRNGEFGGKGACVRGLGHDGLHRDRRRREFDVALSTVERAWKRTGGLPTR